MTLFRQWPNIITDVCELKHFVKGVYIGQGTTTLGRRRTKRLLRRVNEVVELPETCTTGSLEELSICFPLAATSTGLRQDLIPTSIAGLNSPSTSCEALNH